MTVQSVQKPSRPKKQEWTVESLKAFSERLKELWEQGLIRCPLHIPGGNEVELIGIFKKIRRQDYVLSSHRNSYHALLHGISDHDLLTEITKAPRHRTNGGSMCTIDHARRFYSSAIVASTPAIAVGIAYALWQNQSRAKVWCFIGDGALDNGHFWEALRYAEGWDLPVTFVIEDNDRSTCTTKNERNGHCAEGLEIYLRGVTDKVIYYDYEATWPHVGSGKYVQF